MTGDSRLLPLLFAIGKPLAPLYGGAMALRAGLYRRGLLRSRRLPVPVISVGNLVMGGSGKTPTVRHIVRLLLEHGRKPAIISRGYGGRSRERITVVADNERVRSDVALAGDEPYLLASSLPGVPVVTSASRFEAGRYAIDNFNVDCLVMDDGFQHLALERDLDLVLFHGPSLLNPSPLAFHRVLPGGELREPAAALKRTHGLIITSAQEMSPSKIEAAKKVLQKAAPGLPVFVSRYRPAPVLRSVGGVEERMDLARAAEIPAYGFCGIARPESFRLALIGAGFKLLGFSSFADHAAYTAEDLDTLQRQARSLGARILVTTEKDFVKIGQDKTREIPMVEFSVEVEMEDAFDHFLIDFFPHF